MTDSAKLDSKDIKALLKRDPTTNKTAFEMRQCRHCGGVHDRTCPRVKRMTFSPTGAILEVEFWRAWDDEHVIYPEMLGVLQEADGD